MIALLFVSWNLVIGHCLENLEFGYWLLLQNV